MRERSWKPVGSHMMLPLPRCKRRNERTSGWKKSCGVKKQNMKSPPKTSTGGWKILKKLKQIALLIWEHSWTLNSTITINVETFFCNSKTTGQLAKHIRKAGHPDDLDEIGQIQHIHTTIGTKPCKKSLLSQP
ncbi:hypothetical protein EMPG_17368 [Blastomyces silverae]|uniref:Uncharacterized protein n=1 Tax=Blastomyces silverae TaxID=2060906 RepID=A0A0H1B7R7_9EURO|nr:hypothetical protein EMPG_17368 [Blastomyces silverae]